MRLFPQARFFPRAWLVPALAVAGLLAGTGASAATGAATAASTAVTTNTAPASLPAATSGYLPPGSLSYAETRLANGLRMVVQRVDSAPYVSARLVVKSGTDHYPCHDRELPHLVEHLLFSANREFSESDIDERIRGWGGSINAFTYPEQTDLVLDFHSRFQQEALALMGAMVAGFDPGGEDVAREAGVVERESGVDHTPLRLWWSRQPFTQTASTRFYLDAGVWCDAGIAPVHHLTIDDVRRSFDTYYVASNMILVLVGNLDEQGLAAARRVFGALPARPAPVVTPLDIRMPARDDYASGWLSGTANLDQPVAVGFSPFRDWHGYYALSLVNEWLNDRLFRELRSESGIAYTPVADLAYHGTALSMTMAVETQAADTGYTLDYLRALAGEVRAQGIPEEDFERLRTAELLGMARRFERISDRADYLAESVREIEQGKLFDSESFYAGLTYAEFRRLVARDWPARFAVFNDSPPVSWSVRIGVLLGSLALLAAALGWRLWRRLREARPG